MPRVTNPDRAYLRNYQRQWIAQRREEWLKENGPCVKCGSWERLEVDHVDPAKKVDHKVWSWAETRRSQELSKCQVLCYECHLKKTIADRYGEGPPHGTHARYTSKKWRCRCALCRAGHANMNARYK